MGPPFRPESATADRSGLAASHQALVVGVSAEVERAGPCRPSPFGCVFLTSTSASDEASSGRPAGTRKVGELVGFCRSPGKRAGDGPRPARDGSAASHLEGLLLFMQAGPPPSSRAVYGAARLAVRQPRRSLSGRSAFREPDGAVVSQREAGVVGHFPGMAVWVDEDSRVSAVERLRRFSADPRTRRSSLVDDAVDLVG